PAGSHSCCWAFLDKIAKIVYPTPFARVESSGERSVHRRRIHGRFLFVQIRLGGREETILARLRRARAVGGPSVGKDTASAVPSPSPPGHNRPHQPKGRSTGGCSRPPRRVFCTLEKIRRSVTIPPLQAVPTVA